MTWTKLDDKLHNHHKARKAGVDALGLWAVCLSYCGDQLTDGWVPEWYVQTWLPGRKGQQVAARLVRAGLWHTAEIDGEPGWVFHDYLDWNPSREQVLRKRKSNTHRQAEYRARKASEQGEGPDDT